MLPDSPQHQLWLLLLGAIAATYIWRMLGVLLARHIDPQDASFQWISCVSYAMLAGLIARMVFIPIGPLTQTQLWVRIACVLMGLAVFHILKKHVLAGVSAGLLCFIGLVALLPNS